MSGEGAYELVRSRRGCGESHLSGGSRIQKAGGGQDPVVSRWYPPRPWAGSGSRRGYLVFGAGFHQDPVMLIDRRTVAEGQRNLGAAVRG